MIGSSSMTVLVASSARTARPSLRGPAMMRAELAPSSAALVVLETTVVRSPVDGSRRRTGVCVVPNVAAASSVPDASRNMFGAVVGFGPAPTRLVDTFVRSPVTSDTE